MTTTTNTLKLTGNRFDGGNLWKGNMAGVLRMLGMLLFVVCLAGCAKNVVAEGQGARGESQEVIVENRETETGNYEITEVRTEAVPQDERETLESPKVVRKTCASFLESRIDETTESRNNGTTESRIEEVEETAPQADPSVAVATAPLVMGAVEEAASNTNVESQEEIQHIDTIQQAKQRAPYVALRTNLLYDAVLVPNIGLEVWLGAGFTLGVDWFYTWIPLDKQHFYWQTYGGYLTARYYFGKQAAAQPYGGHHVGIYGSMLTYDVEFGGRGYQASKFGFGGGVEYGYSLPVAKNLCLDFNLGVGYQGGEYKTYLPTDDGTGHYVWEGTYKRHWFGPTKAEISLKWLIGPVEKTSSATEKGGGL